MQRIRKKHLPRSIDDDRYLAMRPNKNNTVRYYWHVPGRKPVRLPDGAAMKTALTRLNQQRDADRSGAASIEGTVAWVIGKYRESDRFEKLSESSKRTYNPWLVEMDKLWGPLAISSITKVVCFKFVDKYSHQPATQHNAAAVLHNVMAMGQRHGLVGNANPASELQLSSRNKRDAMWSPKDRASWLEAARQHQNHAETLVLYFSLLEYTAQRPGDVRALPWTGHDGDRKIGYDGEWIRLVQQKTGKYVEIPVHHGLRRVLDGHNTSVAHIGGHIVARPDGRPYLQNHLQILFNEVSRTAGVTGLQQRDLRRTACVRLGESGCTIPEVAAISGHSIKATTQIFETYLPRTSVMGRAAITKWERNETE